MRSLNPSTDITFATAPVEADPADHNRVLFSSRAAAVWNALKTDQPIAPLLDSQSNSPANTDAGKAAAPATAGTGAVDPNSQAGILAACGK